MSRSPRITRTEKIVYDLVEAGAVDASHAALYRRELAALGRAGLIRRMADGSYQAVRAATDRRPVAAAPGSAVALPVPTAPPPAPPTYPLVTRVPQEVIDMLDQIAREANTSRSEAARELVMNAIQRGSGVRKRAG